MYFATAKEMQRIDDLAVKNGLEILQMMELAGWRMIPFFAQLKISRSSRVVILCGKGNNGGDGLAAARHLVNYRYRVQVILAASDMNEHSKHQLKLLKQMKVPILYFAKAKTGGRQMIKQARVIIDGLIGYNLSGTPRSKFAELIELANYSRARVIAYDLPSGMDAAGICYEPCIRADHTLTLALPKAAFLTKSGKARSGQVSVVDIGIPEVLYDRVKSGIRPNFNLNGLKKLQ